MKKRSRTASVHPVDKPANALAHAVFLLGIGAAAGHVLAADGDETVLKSVNVSATASASGELPEVYAGGQVARGARIGLLGNRDNMETPFSVTAYTAKAIANKNAKTIGDLVRGDPSVRTYRGFGNFAEAFTVRGFPLFGDDLGFNSLYGILPRQSVDTAMLERVEVFRGANAFLNGVATGNSGIGGNINLVPKRAQAEPTRAISVGVEEGSLFDEHVDIGQRFVDQQLGLRLNAVHRQGGTAIEDEELKHNFLSLATDWIGEKVRIALDLGYQKHRVENGRPNVSVAATRIPGAPDGDANFSFPWAYAQTEDTFGTLRVDYDFNENLSAHIGYGQRATNENGIYVSASVVDGNTGAISQSVSKIPHEEDVKNMDAGFDARFATGGVSHQINFTASTLSLDANNAFALGSALPNSNLYRSVSQPAPTITPFLGSLSDPTKTQDVDLTSFAIADTLGFFDERLLLTLGARQQQIKQNDYAYSIGSRGARTNHYNEDRLSPSGGVVYKLSTEISVYANYIEGLQQGIRSTAAASPKSFDPYVSKQKEVGVKFDFGTLTTTASVFETKKPSIIRFNTGDLANERDELDGEQRNRGLEINLAGEPIKGLRVLGGATFYDAELVKTQDGINDGNDAPGVPDKQANIDIEWDAPFAQGLTFRGGVTYTDAQYLDERNTLQIPSWTTLDIGAIYTLHYQGKDVVLRGGIDNVTGRDYWSSSMGNFGGYLVMGAPRTASLSATLNF